MSAGNSSSNPRAPNSSLLARRGPLLAAVFALGQTAYLFFSRRPPIPEGTNTRISGTPGMKNIEGAYSNAGATSTHTKAYGGTPMGDKSNDNLREDSPAGSGTPKGVQSGPYGDDQRPSTSTKAEKKFQESALGDQKGK